MEFGINPTHFFRFKCYHYDITKCNKWSLRNKEKGKRKKGKDGQEVAARICGLAPKILPQTRSENPPLPLTNERIITFADMWRGVGERPGRCGGRALSTFLSRR